MKILIYSNQDQEFSNRLKSIKKNYELMGILTPICIDCKDIINIIMTSTNIEVTEVPSILDVSDDNISMFEGLDKTNEYIDELLEHIDNEQPKVTQLDLIGLTEEPPPVVEKSKLSVKEMVSQMKSQRDTFAITSTPSESSQGRTPIKITSEK